MTNNPCLATIRGYPDEPSITEVNVRSGPATNQTLLFKEPVGMSGLQILEVAPDLLGTKGDNGKVFQWFKLAFQGGTTGWVRNDLLEIGGDCSAYGYGVVPPKSFAFDLTRGSQLPADAAKSAVPASAKSPEATPPTSSPAEPASAPKPDNIERVKKASFAITAAFEGTGYAAYNNYDAGIISYGFIQFTLAAGSLFSVIDKYLAHATSASGNELRGYYERIRNKDEGLRKDDNLKRILLDAANEKEMQQAQDEVATANYWDKVLEGYITGRGLILPLSYALLFDMGVNFGTGHSFVRMAEEQLGVPLRSRPGENGITEEQLLSKVADLRKASHYKQAERDNLPGLKARGDLWIDLIKQGDWQLMGNANGVIVVSGRNVQVRNP